MAYPMHLHPRERGLQHLVTVFAMGDDDEPETWPCPDCSGTGTVEKEVRMWGWVETKCPECDGEGEITDRIGF